MKPNNHAGRAIALLLAATLSASGATLIAQSRDKAPPDEGQQQQDQDQQQTKTFTGKIMKLQNGKFALITGQTAQGQASGHFLDDQNDAQKYDGKEVKVTGTLDMASNTIHVTKIEEAA